MTGEIADGWLGTSFMPEHADLFIDPIREGAQSMGRNIEDLWIPFFAPATDLTNSKLVIFNKGPLWEAIRSSGALPGIVLSLIHI